MFGKKNLTHRAALATALLLALSKICAWFGDESDSLISAGIMDVDDEGAGYLSRKLLAFRGRASQSKRFISNRSRLMAAPGCHGVLLTSQGGVGSSAFLTAIEGVQTPGYSFYTNDHKDADGLKHQPASRWTEHDAEGVRRKDGDGGEFCFAKVLVVVGDPVHTVESTHRRFRMKHINKLKQRSGLGSYPKGMPLKYLYDDIVSKGSDTTGITQYIMGWYEASLDRDHWPDIRIVTTKTLLDHAEDHARWIGVEERDLYTFRNMAFDAGQQHRTAPSATAGRAERVMEVFAEANGLVDAMDGLPYDHEVQPDEEPPPLSKHDRRLAERSARRARASIKALRDRQEPTLS